MKRQRMKFYPLLLTLALLGLSTLVLIGATVLPTGEAQAGAANYSRQQQTTPTDDATHAEEIWQQLQEAGYQESWSTVPGKGKLYAGQPPHGALLTTYLNAPALSAAELTPGELPEGAILVKENYNADEELTAVTVMEKRPGYAPEYGDWFWARYAPDGMVQASGQVASCLACHGAVRSNDYIFTFVVAPIEVEQTGLMTATTTATVGTTATDAVTATQAATAEATATATLTTTTTTAPTDQEEEPMVAATEQTDKPSETATPTPGRAEAGATPAATATPLSEEALISSGEALFARYCAACHQPDGLGVAGAYPPLAGNPFVTQEDPEQVIEVVLTGRAGMPHFQDYLADRELAAVISYIRNGWENNASTVSVEQVQTVYESLHSPQETIEHDGRNAEQ
jgi:mono/diheme cytochrome c family protein